MRSNEERIKMSKTKIFQRFKDLDELGQPLKLNFMGKQKHVTNIGAFLTTVQYTIVLAYFLMQCI